MRFGVSVVSSPERLPELVRDAEGFGFDIVFAADHVGLADPIATLATVAATSDQLGIGTYVLNAEFWSPLLLARAASSLAVLSGGRFELGIGAGHAQIEFEQAGLVYRPARERVDRLDACVQVLRRLLDGETVSDETFGLDNASVGIATDHRVPLLVGGNGDSVLGTAGRHADLVGLVGVRSGTGQVQSDLSHWSWDGLVDRMRVVARAAELAGRPSPSPSLLVQCVIETDDREQTAGTLTDESDTSRHLDSPFVMLGTVDELTNQLRRLDALGVDTVTVFDRFAPALAPAIAAFRA